MKDKNITKEDLIGKGMLDVNKYSKQNNKFYSSKEWLTVSNNYKKLHPFCESCLKEDKENPSFIVHHITPISQGGDRFDENNLIAICKICHHEIHSGIGITIDIDFLLKSTNVSTPAKEWWASEKPKMYDKKNRHISNLINNAKGYEKDNSEKSIALYFKAIKEIDNFDKVLENDPIVEKAYYKRFNIPTYRNIKYPINRLSLLLEKAERYDECIKVIEDYEKKNDKYGLLSSDLQAIKKRKFRTLKKLIGKSL